MVRRRRRGWVRRAWRKTSRGFKIKLLAILVAFIQLLVYEFRPIPVYETALLDLWFRIRGNIEEPKDVVVVSLDDLSANKLNISPLVWPRSIQVQLLEKLSAANAKMVVYDLLFDQRREKSSDLAFAEAMKKIPTVLGKVVVPVRGSAATGARRYEYLEPLDIFAENAHEVILFRAPSDHDGVVRRFQTEGGKQQGRVPIADAIPFGDMTLPGRRDFINYYGAPEAVQIVSIFDALSSPDSQLKELFENKIVFVGKLMAVLPAVTSSQSADNIADSFPVPTSSRRMFGVEIHATITGNILEGRWIRRYSHSLETFFLMFFAAFLSYLIFSLRPVLGGLAFLCYFLLYGLASYWAFLNGVFMPGVILGVVIFGAYVLSTIYYYMTSHRSIRELETAIGIKLENS